MPLTQTLSLYHVDTPRAEEGQEYLRFRYVSERVAYYEAVNERLLTEYSAYKQKQLEKANRVGEKAFGGVPEAIYSLRGKRGRTWLRITRYLSHRSEKRACGEGAFLRKITSFLLAPSPFSK